MSEEIKELNRQKRNIKGERVKEIRKLECLSQTEFANMVGATKFQVSNWERGVNQPSIKNIRKIRDALGYNINEDIEAQIQRKLYKKELELLKE